MRAALPVSNLLIAATLLACTTPADPALVGAPPLPTPPTQVADATTPVASVEPVTSAAATRPERRPITAADDAAHAAYRTAMQEGRTQTRAKAYDAAIAAFGRALARRPNDARALAERGYARLLASDLDGARTDLELARQRTQDPARLGPIWFNVGLVAEAAGNPDGARRAFALSNELRPGKAVAARLRGETVCTAEIDRTPVAASAFASWQLLYDNLRADTVEPALTTDAAVQQALGFDPRRDTDGLWALDFYNAAAVDSNSRASVLVGRAPDRQLLLFGELSFADSGACQPHGSLTVTPVGGLVHARHVDFLMDWALVPIDPKDPANVPCDQDGAIPRTCEFDCHAFAVDVDDYIIDLTGKQRLLHVRRTTNTVASEDPRAVEAALPIRVSVREQAVTLTGGGCDTSVPITTRKQ